jgi:glutamate-1-semialdehyde 2,1-aminomutase
VNAFLRRALDVAQAMNPYQRVLLSRAKQPSLAGHPRMALRFSRWVKSYDYSEEEFFSTDSAPEDVARQRRAGFERLATELERRAPQTLALSRELEEGISDVAFVNAYRVPFPYRAHVKARLKVGSLASQTEGARIRDLDGNWSYDLSGSYGVGLFSPDFYKGCIERGSARARDLGLVLGPYHPIIADNVRRLKEISGMDEVSFHMSGTEAVMQAVRLARYHSGRSHVVRFAGAYHGWWDGVQAGPGNPRPTREVYTLKEMDEVTLKVLHGRRDIACVLVNPVQAMHPNKSPPSDSTLLASDRTVSYDKAAYAKWLSALREVCSARGIALIFDEVFLGFRLALGGAQEYFGVDADLVTYGKSLGGGLPVGVLCGKHEWMRRFRDEAPADVCFARGTFNSHPYVMATMNEFLRHLDQVSVRARYQDLDARWEGRARSLNGRLEHAGLPVRVAAMTSVWTTLYTEPSRYNWMFQYYLREQGLALAWTGTARFIFSHDLTDADFEAISSRFVMAAQVMQADGWWWQGPELTNRAIKRQVTKEMALARLGLRRSARVPLLHGVEPLTPHQPQRGPVVDQDVVERVGEDLGDPDQPRLKAPRRAQPERTSDQSRTSQP